MSTTSQSRAIVAIALSLVAALALTHGAEAAPTGLEEDRTLVVDGELRMADPRDLLVGSAGSAYAAVGEHGNQRPVGLSGYAPMPLSRRRPLAYRRMARYDKRHFDSLAGQSLGKRSGGGGSASLPGDLFRPYALYGYGNSIAAAEE